MLVSILIPCYNAQEYISEAIGSAFNQQTGEVSVEVIVLDDGSTDDSLSVIRAIEHFTPLRVLATANKGAQVARNTLLSQANGQYIQFLDADDWLEPGKVERQLAAGLSSKQIPLCDFYIHAPNKTTEFWLREPILEGLIAWERIPQTASALFTKEQLVS